MDSNEYELLMSGGLNPQQLKNFDIDGFFPYLKGQLDYGKPKTPSGNLRLLLSELEREQFIKIKYKDIKTKRRWYNQESQNYEVIDRLVRKIDAIELDSGKKAECLQHLIKMHDMNVKFHQMQHLFE